MVLYIYGSGGTGREVLDIAKRINLDYRVWSELIFIDDYREQDQLNGIRVLKFDGIPKNVEECGFVITVGEPEFREELFNRARNRGLRATSIIDPSAKISEFCKIGPGCIIYPHAVVSTETTLNDNVMIQFNAVVGHDASIGSHSVVSSGAVIGGSVKLGKKSFVGMSACIKDGCNVGDQVILGMGSVLGTDIGSSLIAVGNPARVSRKNESLRVFG